MDVETAGIAKSGSLLHDREFAIFDSDDKFVNGKRYPQVHSIRANYRGDLDTVTLCADSLVSTSFHLKHDVSALESVLFRLLGFTVRIRHDENGLPDDTDSPGPTVVSTATLEAVASWFPALSLDDVRRRFRANLEIGDVPPFWEDRLFSTIGKTVQFKIGDAVFQGVNPCQRCIVPTRDPRNATPFPDFQKTFMEKRKVTLPDWANVERFNHYYRLAVNTRSISQAGKVVRRGDCVYL